MTPIDFSFQDISFKALNNIKQWIHQERQAIQIKQELLGLMLLILSDKYNHYEQRISFFAHSYSVSFVYFTA